MKYFYKLLRLFFCPHSYRTIRRGAIKTDNEIIGSFYDKECRYCGKCKRFNLFA